MNRFFNLTRTASSLPLLPLTALLMLALVLPARAELLSASASLSATNVVTGEAFQLRVRITTDKKENLSWPSVEGLDAFAVTRSTATSTSSQTTIVNGAVSSSTSFVTDFIFSLVTQEGGTYTLGPIIHTHEGTSRDLGRAVVTVTQTEPGLSMRSSLSKHRLYAGEQVLYTLRIMPKDGVQSIDRPDDLQKRIGEKFYFHQLDQEITRKTATVDGREVPVYDVRIALFPLLSGPARLDGISITYRQLRPGVSQGQSFFDMFFGGGGSVVTQTATASPLRVNITPLPPGAPDDFTGSVGTYNVKASLSQAVVAAGEPVTLTVTVRGNGNPRTITRPSLPDLPHFEVYDPEESGGGAVEGSELWTTRTFKYVLIPGREGSHELGRASFPYFDPARGAYARAESAPLTLRVTPGSGPAAASPFATRREIAELGADIRHIRTGDFRLRDEATLPFTSPLFLALVILPPLALAGAFIVRRRRARLRNDTALSRRTRAGAERRRRLREARKALDAGQAHVFYRALSEAVVAFPSDKLNREFRGLTLPEAMGLLAEHGAATETAAAYDDLLQRCDFVLFAGMTPPSEEMRRDLDRAEALLTRMDKELS